MKSIDLARRLLLISNSTLHGGGYLDHAEEEIRNFVGKAAKTIFVPFAVHDWGIYAAKAQERFRDMGFSLTSIHDLSNMPSAIDEADVIFVGGGNTFRLLNGLYNHDLLGPIRRRVAAGMPYIGSSAGSIVACPTLKTTKDMPVVQPPSFEALGLVPFQISPHYLDPDASSTHMGETQEEPILQFLEENEEPVVGLREGSILRVQDGAVTLKGPNTARIFRRYEEPVEATTGSNLCPVLWELYIRGALMNAEEILLLTPREIQGLLSIDECIVAVEHAFHLHGEGKTAPPGVLSMHSRDGGFHIKAGVLELSRPYFGAKVNGNFAENGKRFGLPTIQGVIVLCDAEKGSPLAVMDSRGITSLRTGAATAVAAKYLARRDSHTATICGCGNQGRIQVRAVSRVCSLQNVFAYDKSEEQALRFAQELTEELAIPVTSVTDLSAAVRRSGICVTCTPSRQPLLGSDDVKPGTFIAAVGADSPEKQELHPSLMAKSKIITDILQQSAVMGDLHHALEAGVLTQADVYAELGDVVSGKKLGRESDDEIIIFDSTGMALQDVAAAALVYEKAERQGSGVRLSFAA